MIVMNNGLSVVGTGETTALFGNPQSDYTRELMRAAFGHVGAA